MKDPFQIRVRARSAVLVGVGLAVVVGLTVAPPLGVAAEAAGLPHNRCGTPPCLPDAVSLPSVKPLPDVASPSTEKPLPGPGPQPGISPKRSSSSRDGVPVTPGDVVALAAISTVVLGSAVVTMTMNRRRRTSLYG